MHHCVGDKVRLTTGAVVASSSHIRGRLHVHTGSPRLDYFPSCVLYSPFAARPASAWSPFEHYTVVLIRFVLDVVPEPTTELIKRRISTHFA